jgi:PGF-pre-PGF domain-containing protein
MKFKGISNILFLVSVVLFSFILVWAVNDVSLVSPIDGATNWTNTVTFTCKVDTFEAEADVNLTLYHNQSGTWTNVSTNDAVVEGADTLFTITIADGQNIGWNCRADNGSETDGTWNAANFTVHIDNTNASAFNFTSPVNQSTTTATTNNTPLFDWNDTVDPNFLNYTLILTDSNDFANPNYTYELDGVVTNSSFEIGTDVTANGSTSTAMEDGLWYWKVIAYDGAEANGSDLQYTNISIDDGTTNGFYEYELDTTNPSITHDCSHSSIFMGETLTCTCSGSDNIDTNITESYTASPSTATPGTFSTTCTVTDNVNNTNSSTLTYIVVSPPNYGGSSSGSSTSSKSNTVSILEADTPYTFTIIDNLININSIEVKSKVDANNVKISVKNYETKPSSVSDTSNEVYQYLDIGLSNLENKDLSYAIVTFEVSEEWLDENSITKEEVILLRYVDSSWQELETSFVKVDGNNFVYTSTTAGFSTFAISYDEKEIVEEKEKKSDIEEITEQVTDIVEEYDTKTYLILFAVLVTLVIVAVYNKQIIAYVKKAKKNKHKK